MDGGGDNERGMRSAGGRKVAGSIQRPDLFLYPIEEVLSVGSFEVVEVVTSEPRHG